MRRGEPQQHSPRNPRRGPRWGPPPPMILPSKWEPQRPARNSKREPNPLSSTTNNNNRPLRLPPFSGTSRPLTPPNVERRRNASPPAWAANHRNAARPPVSSRLSTAKRDGRADSETDHNPRNKRTRTHANTTTPSAGTSWDQHVVTQYSNNVGKVGGTKTKLLTAADKNLSLSQNAETKPKSRVVEDHLRSFQESQQDAREIRALLVQVESMLPVGNQVGKTPLNFDTKNKLSSLELKMRNFKLPEHMCHLDVYDIFRINFYKTRIPRLIAECCFDKDFKKNFAKILSLTRSR